MIDYWLIFNLLKPFVDIILQTYIETLREDHKDVKEEEEESLIVKEDISRNNAWVKRKNITVPMTELK